jgi:outer membrane lipopolysaccharide assembly protein LptE/RlpB
MKKVLTIVMLVMMVVMLSGCIEFAWKSSGHVATQAPVLTADVKNKNFGWDYANPLPSEEVISPKQDGQPQIIVVQVPAVQPESVAPVYYPVQDSQGTQLVTWGNLDSGGK